MEPNCAHEVRYREYYRDYVFKCYQCNKIIMENKQTIEESAKKYINLPLDREMDEEERYFNSRDKEYDAFISGAKWQEQRMYSEKDLREAFNQGQENIEYHEGYGYNATLTESEWFEQFKKTNNGK